MCLYVSHFFVRSSNDRHLGCFRILAIVNNTINEHKSADISPRYWFHILRIHAGFSLLLSMSSYLLFKGDFISTLYLSCLLSHSIIYVIFAILDCKLLKSGIECLRIKLNINCDRGLADKGKGYFLSTSAPWMVLCIYDLVKS